jgi:hypothetical protein
LAIHKQKISTAGKNAWRRGLEDDNKEQQRRGPGGLDVN